MKISIKNLSLLCGFVLSSGAALAQNSNIENKTRIIRDFSQNTILSLNHETVRCSAVGYGQSELKINVPDLEYLAFFDHSNIGENVPCMTAGACSLVIGDEVIFEGLDPSDVIDENNPTQEVELHLVLEENYVIDHQQKTCHRYLTENINTTVRNLPFFHARGGDLGEFPYELCNLL